MRAARRPVALSFRDECSVNDVVATLLRPQCGFDATTVLVSVARLLVVKLVFIVVYNLTMPSGSPSASAQCSQRPAGPATKCGLAAGDFKSLMGHLGVPRPDSGAPSSGFCCLRPGPPSGPVEGRAGRRGPPGARLRRLRPRPVRACHQAAARPRPTCCSARSGTAMDLGPDYFRALALGFVSRKVLQPISGMSAWDNGDKPAGP